jgi:predicted dehydrogenase
MTKFLIAGYGSIGRRHFQNLLALGEKDILFYRTHQSTIPEEALEGYPVETDLQKALDHKPDAVIVSNPTAAHLDVAIPAAAAGCHLLLEKPISHDTRRLGDLDDALRQGGGSVLVAYQFRFHPVLQQVKRLLDESAVGKPLSVRAHWGEYLPDWHPWGGLPPQLQRTGRSGRRCYADPFPPDRLFALVFWRRGSIVGFLRPGKPSGAFG